MPRKALMGFEEDYAKFIARKDAVEQEVKAEYEKVLAERTAKLDELINLVSEEFEEVVEETKEDEVVEENVGE